MSLLQMSCSGAVFILAVVLMRGLTIHILPKRTFLILWGVVFMRLLIPYAVPSAFSVYSFAEQKGVHFPLSALPVETVIPSESQEQTEELFSPALQGKTEILQGQSEVLQGQSKAIQGKSEMLQGQLPVVDRVFASVWFVGMVLCAVFFIASYWRSYLEFQTSLPVRNDFTEQWIEGHLSRRSISVRQSDKISAPLTYGIAKPVILLPKDTDWENVKQLAYIFQHEYVHICRYDSASKIVAVLVLCIHWFNPFVWVMYILFNRDIELACDESVLHSFGVASRSDYAHMLINLAAKKSGFVPFCNGFSEKAIEERITVIMKTKRTTVLSHLFSCLILFVMVSLFATSAIVSEDSGHKAPPVIREPQMSQGDAAVNEEREVSIVHESADILYYEDGAPYIHDILTNATDRTITETEYCMLAYDEMGSPLKLYWNFLDSSAVSSYENLVRSRERILPNRTEDYRGGWSLNESQAAYALVCLKQVVFEDGTVWNNPDYDNWFAAYAGKAVGVEDLQNYYPHEYEIE